jgi:hypothetical protein
MEQGASAESMIVPLPLQVFTHCSDPVHFKDFKVINLLGEGSFGRVFKV